MPRSVGLSMKSARGARLKKKRTEPCTSSWSRSTHQNSSPYEPLDNAMSHRGSFGQGRQADLCPIILALLTLLNGCGSGNNRVLEEVSEKVYTVEPTANISIHNYDGAVSVYGSDVNEVRVRSLKRAYSRDRLNQISIDVSAKPGAVSITAK